MRHKNAVPRGVKNDNALQIEKSLLLMSCIFDTHDAVLMTKNLALWAQAR